jgi:hypothetical protein
VIIVGLFLFAAAVATAATLILQNRASIVRVHALGHTWSGHLYWVLVAGLIIALAGVVGLAIMRRGLSRARGRHRERAELLADNKRLTERLGDPDDSSFFSGDTEATDAAAPGPDTAETKRSLRRRHHAS